MEKHVKKIGEIDLPNLLNNCRDQGWLEPIDEHDDSPTILVARGVSFIATANIGMEYTATRVIDRAILDRFSKRF